MAIAVVAVEQLVPLRHRRGQGGYCPTRRRHRWQRSGWRSWSGAAYGSRRRPPGALRLSDLDVICAALGCQIGELLIPDDLWLQAKLAQLPQGIAGPVGDWARTLHDGGPRSRLRDPATATNLVRTILPALRDWSTRYGHLREVTRDDISAHLEPLHGSQKAASIGALRSLFTWAKRTKVVFGNPATRLRSPRIEDRILHPLTADQLARTIEAATTLHARLFVVLAAIHAARPGQIRALRLNDVDLGQTALGLGPVSHTLLAPALRGLPATIERLRMDRQLEEAIAAGGDPLHLAAVFGISDAAALRWAANARALLAAPPDRS